MRISGISTAVPKKQVSADDLVQQFGQETVEKVTSNTGIFAHREASVNTCTSDLCYEAADRLLNTMDIARDSIDALLFVSQTPDYMIPATSPILQHRLGLSVRTFTLDLNQGCTGYTDGLLVAHSLMRGMGFQRILLLAGDVLTRIVDPEDQGTAPLFGDAGSASLLENDTNDVLFSIGTDGESSAFIRQQIGYRTGLSVTTPVESDGVALKLDGAEIFSFTIKRIPPMVKKVLADADWSVDDVDHFVFHQANRFILNYLTRKLRIPADKCPLCLEEFGNTSSASIPLTMVTRIAEELATPKKLVLVGFGVGMAWSAVAMETEGMTICPLIEIEDPA
jgi:3-oxoacyl-[acyl-carrier-protein] synthase-3